MRALCLTLRDPFNPLQHREVREVRRRARIRALAPRTRQPFICVLNSRPVMRAEWGRRLRDGDTLAFVTLPQGGDDGSQVLSVVLMVVVSYFAPYLSGYMQGATGTFAQVAAAGTATLGGSLLTAGITMVGAMMVNALIPPPKQPASMAAADMTAASPTYSLSAQGNSARLGQPIPVIYGRHIIYPDFAAQPYTEFSGNEQYLYQLMVIGQGYYDIEAIRIEDTPISSFDEITYEIVQPGESVTLFPSNVVNSIEVSGQEMEYGVALGPFVASAEGTTANELAFDIVLPRGLYYANDSGGLASRALAFRCEVQQVDDYGAAVGSWIIVGAESISAATTTPIRRTYRYGVYPGRYQCRVTRLTAKVSDTRTGNDLAWGGLRAYLPGSQQYGDITLIAMRMRATNNLSSQASRKINLIVQRKLQVWDIVGGWSSPVPTRNPAWALADIARAAYGAELADARINLPGLVELATAWDSRGDRFDGVFDSQSTVWESLQNVARAGRAHPFLQGGVLHAFRDAPASLPVGMFTPRNMVKGSFKLTYKMPSEEMADAVDIEYYDDVVWGWRTVRAKLAGSTASTPYKFRLVGVTSREQAWREGMYMAACNKYRRRFTSHATEMEGFIPSLGDLVTLTHDMPRWGQFAEVTGWDAGAKLLGVSEPLDFSAGGMHYLAFRARDGSPAGPWIATATADPYAVTLTDWDAYADPTPDFGQDRERSHVAFGPANTQWIRARVLTVRPSSMTTVNIDCVIESDAVHTADTGAAPGADAWQLPSKFTAPRILGLTAKSMPDAVDRMILSWQPAAGAERYLIEQSSDGVNWTRTGDTSANSYTAISIYGPATIVRVAAQGLTRGPWVEVAYGQAAGYMWGADADLMWNTDDTTAMWS